MSARIVPISLKEAKAFVARHHRHHKPPVSHKWSIGLAVGDQIVGVCMVGRPVSRILDDGWTLEINRLCVIPPDGGGIRNAASMLLARARKIAGLFGYSRIITYTLPEEGGASLRGAGYRMIGTAGGGKWSRGARPRVDLHPTQQKIKWESDL